MNTGFCGQDPRDTSPPGDEPFQDRPVEQPATALPTCEERLQGVEWIREMDEEAICEGGLPYVLLATHVRPSLLLAEPVSSPDPEARKIVRSLETSRSPEAFFRAAKRKIERPILRRAFLKQGYFRFSDPRVARAAVRELDLSDLFDGPRVLRSRGDGMETLVRQGEHYVDSAGRRAELWLFDRVSETAEDLGAPLHVDLAEVRHITGAQRTLPRRVAGRAAWLDLVFPDGERRSALATIDEGKTRIACLGGDQKTLPETLRRAAQFWRDHAALVEAAQRIAAERLRFDEPTDEADDTQEDGALRVAWKKAYFRGEETFKFREVEYPVYDRRGSPVPPEVCLDFVLDAWERASGSWYTPRGGRPRRTAGAVDFTRLAGLSRRHTPSVLRFAAETGSPLSRYDIPRRDRVSFRSERAFSEALCRNAGAIREGDALVIYGIREEDLEEHYHSVLVLETDPLTGMPTTVGDNQGRPRIGSLAQAMRSAPRRAIEHRLRLDAAAMASLAGDRPGADAGADRR